MWIGKYSRVLFSPTIIIKISGKRSNKEISRSKMTKFSWICDFILIHLFKSIQLHHYEAAFSGREVLQE